MDTKVRMLYGYILYTKLEKGFLKKGFLKKYEIYAFRQKNSLWICMLVIDSDQPVNIHVFL